MISRVRQPAPRTHLPLRQLALCLDCDECFGIGPETCPSCGSSTWTSLARFLARASSAVIRGAVTAASVTGSSANSTGRPTTSSHGSDASCPDGTIALRSPALVRL